MLGSKFAATRRPWRCCPVSYATDDILNVRRLGGKSAVDPSFSDTLRSITRRRRRRPVDWRRRIADDGRGRWRRVISYVTWCVCLLPGSCGGECGHEEILKQTNETSSADETSSTTETLATTGRPTLRLCHYFTCFSPAGPTHHPPPPWGGLESAFSPTRSANERRPVWTWRPCRRLVRFRRIICGRPTADYCLRNSCQGAG